MVGGYLKNIPPNIPVASVPFCWCPTNKNCFGILSIKVNENVFRFY